MKNYSNEIAGLKVQIANVSNERYELQKSSDLLVKGVLDIYFNPFKEMEIKASGDYATFHMKDEDGMNREIFSLYFDERYQRKAELRISYYSSSTNNEFELSRLVLLGRTAKVMKEKSEEVLSEIKRVKNINSGRLEELFSLQLKFEKQIKDYQNSELQDRKVQIELGLRSEGVEFDCPREIKFKFNYVIYVKSLKIIDVSKSGKTCTVIFKTRDGIPTREENCNIQSVIDQVTSLHKSIVLDFELI